MRWFTKHICALLLLFSMVAYGQTKEELQQERRAIQKEIQQTNELLSKTRSKKKNSLAELEALNQKISARRNLIRTMNKEISFIDASISQNKEQIASLEGELSLLKEQYAELILQAYESKSNYSRIMFLFSAENFNQAYRRFRYMQEYGSFRRHQAAQILVKQKEISQLITRLEDEKREKESLLSKKQDENRQLASEQSEQKGLVQSLESQESQLRAELKKKEKAAGKLQKAIESIIEEELRKAREGSKGSAEAFTLTPEAKALSNSFAANKGKLPWPVERGVITGNFGKQPHPVLKGIYVENKGVLISTQHGSAARAVFDGTVKNVLIIPGNHKAVMINHGEYFTIYSNLDEIYVSPGEKVNTKQLLGKIHTNVETGQAVLNFQLWKLTQTQNPNYWLYK